MPFRRKRSWRESTPQDAQRVMDGLVDASLKSAQALLSKNGEFFPYAMTADHDGKIRMEAAFDGDEHPASLDVIDMLLAAMKAQRSEIQAAAIVVDVRLAGSDGVRVELEHANGLTVTVVARYSLDGADKHAVFGDLVGVEGERRIWA